MAPPPLVSAEGLQKSYGTFVALQGFSLEVPAGEILALVGPNGAGKTTALKLLAGLLTPTRGRALIGGLDVQRHPLAVKQQTAFLPDQPFLYESLTVAETVRFIAGMHRVPAAALQARAQELLPLFSLEDVLAQRVGELSFGMKSRLVLLLSLLREPRVLIMDEPFFGLDPQTLRLIKQLLRARAARGLAVLLSTHQLPVVEDLADRIAVLHRGRVVALGDLARLQQEHGGQRLEEVFFHLTG
jgi:ABC-2 type transport system ATP-binding protein